MFSNANILRWKEKQHKQRNKNNYNGSTKSCGENDSKKNANTNVKPQLFIPQIRSSQKYWYRQ